MFHSWRFVGCSLALLLSGCATYRAKPLVPEETAASFEARRLSDPSLDAFVEKYLGSTDAGAPAAWDLDALTLAALYDHPELAVARAQWQAAKAAHIAAGERPNPSISAGPTWVSNPELGLTPWIGAFALDVPIETAGKRGIRQSQAAAQADGARQRLLQTAWKVRSGVRSSLIALLSARASLAVLRHQGGELNQNAQLLGERARRGQASPLGAAQAAILADKNRLAVEDAERQETQAQARLADAIGLPLRALDGVQFSSATWIGLVDPQDPALAQARRAALTGRADLLAALADYAASEAALRLEVAKQYPDVQLGPGYTYDQGQNKWGIGVTVPIPILSRNKGPIAEAEARREEAAARFIALQDRVINELDGALASDRAAYRKWQAADDIFSAETRRTHSLRDLLRPGDVSRLTFFRSQLDLDSTELARDDAWRQAQEAQGVLEDALERPLSGRLRLPAEAIERNPRAERRP